MNAEDIVRRLIEGEDNPDDLPLKLQLGIWYPPLYTEIIHEVRQFHWEYLGLRHGDSGALFRWVHGVPYAPAYDETHYDFTIFRDETGSESGIKGGYYLKGRGYVSWTAEADKDYRPLRQRDAGDYVVHGSFVVPQNGHLIQQESESVADFAARCYDTIVSEGTPDKELLDKE